MFPIESLVSVCLTPCDRAVRYTQISPVSSIRVPVPFTLITVLLLCSAMCFVPRSWGYPLCTLGLPSATASIRLGHFFCFNPLLERSRIESGLSILAQAIGLDEILAKSCSILPSVGGSVLGALFSSKVASSWILIPGNSYGVYISSINLASILCSNVAFKLASWCLLCSLSEGATLQPLTFHLFFRHNRSIPICKYKNINISCTNMS